MIIYNELWLSLWKNSISINDNKSVSAVVVEKAKSLMVGRFEPIILRVDRPFYFQIINEISGGDDNIVLFNGFVKKLQ